MPGGAVPGRVRRRALLLGAVAAVATPLSGCLAHPGRPAPRATGAAPTVLGLGPLVPPEAIAATVRADFARDNPGFRLAYPSDPDASSVGWWLIADGGSPIDLRPALEALNFDRGVLPEAMWAALANRGFSLPSTLHVYALSYAPAALAAASVAPPTPAWTWADFIQACIQVGGALRAGRLAKTGVAFVLPNMTVPGAVCGLDDEPMWDALIEGFGGVLVADGRSAVDSPAAAAGLAALLDAVHRFGSDPAAPPAAADLHASPTAAMSFGILPMVAPAKTAPSARPVARFPVLPRRAVVPSRVDGRGLHPGQDALARIPPGLAVPAHVLEGAARWFIWSYMPAQQGLFAQAGVLPLIGAGELQQQFLLQHYAMAVGPQDLLFAAPELGPAWRGPGSAWLKELGAAVGDPAMVPVLLRDLSQRIDAALRPASTAGSGAAATAG